MRNKKDRIRWTEGVHYKSIQPAFNDGMKYEMLTDMIHLGPDGLEKTIPWGRQSDGATCAIDLCPEAFFLHDELCLDPKWDDGTPVTNWEASKEYRKILKRYGHSMRGCIRHYATFVFGGGKIKKLVGWW